MKSINKNFTFSLTWTQMERRSGVRIFGKNKDNDDSYTSRFMVITKWNHWTLYLCGYSEIQTILLCVYADLARSGTLVFGKKNNKNSTSLESIARLSSEEEKRRFIDSLNASTITVAWRKLCLAVIGGVHSSRHVWEKQQPQKRLHFTKTLPICWHYVYRNIRRCCRESSW